MKLVVCSLRAAPEMIIEYNASHAISLLSPESQWPEFNGVNHLRLALNDIAMITPGLVAPGESDAERLLSFIRKWDRQRPMLIHCWAGISRSTAAAFTAMCALRDESEMILAEELRELSPSATPNRMLVGHVDKLLGRDGRMVRAIESIGRGADAYEGKTFEVKI
jgi:predicted protein tyrosine phosphatase